MAILNNAIINMDIHVSLWCADLASFRLMMWSGIPRSHSSHIFRMFFGEISTDFQSDYPVYVLTSSVKEFFLDHTLISIFVICLSFQFFYL